MGSRKAPIPRLSRVRGWTNVKNLCIAPVEQYFLKSKDHIMQNIMAYIPYKWFLQNIYLFLVNWPCTALALFAPLWKLSDNSAPPWWDFFGYMVYQGL